MKACASLRIGAGQLGSSLWRLSPTSPQRFKARALLCPDLGAGLRAVAQWWDPEIPTDARNRRTRARAEDPRTPLPDMVRNRDVFALS